MKYNTHMWRYILCVLVGSYIGYTVFTWANIPLRLTPEIRRGFRLYVGAVVNHDIQKNKIILAVPSSSYFGIQGVQLVEFSYEDNTFWGSVEYSFEDDVLVTRRYAQAEEMLLPRGTLTNVLRNLADDRALHALSIMYRKRVSL